LDFAGTESHLIIRKTPASACIDALIARSAVLMEVENFRLYMQCQPLTNGTGFESRCCPKYRAMLFLASFRLRYSEVQTSLSFKLRWNLDVAVAFWMVVGPAAKRDAK